MGGATFCEDLVAGTVAGVAGIVVGQPADTVKVRIQTQGAEGAKKLYASSLDCAVQIVRREGPITFFKGILAPIVANAPINATIFVIYGESLRRFRHWKLEKDPVRLRNKSLSRESRTILGPQYHFLAGCMGGLAQTPFSTPNELVKIKEQIVQGKGESTWNVARKLVRQHGFRRGLYQAFGIYFATYEAAKNALLQAGTSPLKSSFAAGGIAGVLSFLILHPIDVLKSCRQMQSADTPTKATSTRAIAVAGMRQDGFGFFLRGVGPSVLRAGPVSAVIFVVYEQVLSLI